MKTSPPANICDAAMQLVLGKVTLKKAIDEIKEAAPKVESADEDALEMEGSTDGALEEETPQSETIEELLGKVSLKKAADGLKNTAPKSKNPDDWTPEEETPQWVTLDEVESL